MDDVSERLDARTSWFGPRLQSAMIAVLIGLIASPFGAGAAESVVVTTNTYAVTGSNLAELQASIAKNRPWKASEGFEGRTVSSIKCRYSMRAEPGQLWLSGLEVNTYIVVTVPAWRAPTNADPAFRAYWAQFVRGLLQHEEGHVQIARAAAVEVRHRLLALPASGSPEALESAAQQTLKAVLDEFHRKETDYDRRTRHGTTAYNVVADLTNRPSQGPKQEPKTQGR